MPRAPAALICAMVMTAAVPEPAPAHPALLTQNTTDEAPTTVSKHLDGSSNVVVVDCPLGAIDCTTQLQAALSDLTADHIIVPRRASPWPSGPLTLNRSNVKLTLAAGTNIQARRGAFVEPDSLLTVTGWVKGRGQSQTTTIRNISILGVKSASEWE